MSDERKYRQRGYQDSDRERTARPHTPRPAPEPGAPAGARRMNQGPKTINMPGFRDVVRCSQCGNVLAGTAITHDSCCPRCGTDLHSCAQCTSFDPGSRFECMETIAARVSPKNVRNTCTLYAARTTVERETTTPRVGGAHKAFDDLFNF
jgi:predicted RNA-binding Zn-ribbon protein involved in translation (DUF1610 family)